MVPAREGLDETVERAADRQRFDRPKRRPKQGAKTKPSLELELFAQEPPAGAAERPLLDLMPEAYETEGL